MSQSQPSSRKGNDENRRPSPSKDATNPSPLAPSTRPLIGTNIGPPILTERPPGRIPRSPGRKDLLSSQERPRPQPPSESSPSPRPRTPVPRGDRATRFPAMMSAEQVLSTTTAPVATESLLLVDDLPAAPPGRKWHQAAILVDDDEIGLGRVYDPRITKNLTETHVQMVPARDAPDSLLKEVATRVRTEFAAILQQNGLSHLVEYFGIGEVSRYLPNPPRVFAIVMDPDHLERWQEVDTLAREYTARTISKETALAISSTSCPQYELPIRSYFERHMGYSEASTSNQSNVQPLIIKREQNLPFVLEPDKHTDQINDVFDKGYGRLHLPRTYDANTIGLPLGVVGGYPKTPRAGRSITLLCEDMLTKNQFYAELASMHTVIPSGDKNALYNVQIMGNKPRSDLCVESPSLRYALREKETFDVMSAWLEGYINETLTTIGDAALVKENLIRQKDARLIQEYTSRRDMYIRHAKEVPTDRTIGKVILTSGFRTTAMHLAPFLYPPVAPDAPCGAVMDYALIDVHKDYEGNNELPSDPEWQANLRDLPSGFDQVLAHKFIHAFAEPQPGETVMKFGSASGFTIGTVMKELKRHKRRVFIPRDTNPSSGGTYAWIESWEIVVEGIPSYGHSEFFSSPGDSGQPVFNARGECIGLVLGGPTSQGKDSNFVCITPMSTIIADLETQFQVKVIGLKLPSIDPARDLPTDLRLQPTTTSAPKTENIRPSSGRGRGKNHRSKGDSRGYGAMSSEEGEDPISPSTIAERATASTSPIGKAQAAELDLPIAPSSPASASQHMPQSIFDRARPVSPVSSQDTVLIARSTRPEELSPTAGAQPRPGSRMLRRGYRDVSRLTTASALSSVPTESSVRRNFFQNIRGSALDLLEKSKNKIETDLKKNKSMGTIRKMFKRKDRDGGDEPTV